MLDSAMNRNSPAGRTRKTAPNLAVRFPGHKGGGGSVRRLCIILIVASGCTARRRRLGRRRLRRWRGGLRVGRSRVLLIAFLIVLHGPQPRDILLMLLVGFRKSVAAGAVGDKIEFARARRIGRSFERR